MNQRETRTNAAIKELYEFSDEEWSEVPEPKYYHICKNLNIRQSLQMEHETSTLGLNDVLVTIFRQIIGCPSTVGSVLLVSKKWNLLVRDQQVWKPHPLGIPLIVTTTNTLPYDVLAYYIRPLIEHEIDAKLTRLCRKKETIAKRFPKKQITALPSDLDQWRTQLLDEVRRIVGLNEATRTYINQNTLRGDYYQYCVANCLTTRQTAVMVAIIGQMRNFQPRHVVEVWPGIKHLFKSCEQLHRECQTMTSTDIKLRVAAGCTAESGLRKCAIPANINVSNIGFGYMASNSFSLSTKSVFSCPKFTTDYHTMEYGSWMTFLSPVRWVASFAFWESTEHNSFGCHFFVIGDNNTGSVKVINTKERFVMNPFTVELGNTIVKTVYEISDQEWELLPQVDYNFVLQTLTGANWDIFDVI
jgi:hypothetical protein